MEFRNPITALAAINDIADEYEIQSIATSKDSETIVYGIALLVEQKRIHAKFIVITNTDTKHIQSIQFIPHEDLPELGYFELVSIDLVNFITMKSTNISKVLQYPVLQKFVRIFKTLKKSSQPFIS